MPNCHIAPRLIALRTAAGITQETLARALSVSNKTVSKWENGISMPDLEMLSALADHFGVSTDFLLGRTEAPAAEDNPARPALEGLSATETLTRAFALAESIIPAEYSAVVEEYREGKLSSAIPPPMDPRGPRNAIERHDVFHYTENSDELTVAIMLMQGRDDFAFLRQPDRRARLLPLFAFLADPDALALVCFIHSQHCSESFTPGYIAENLKLPLPRAEEILGEAAKLRFCSTTTAHLSSGDITIYTARGEGTVLAMLSMAHAYLSRKKHFGYHYAPAPGSKMIKGEIQ